MNISPTTSPTLINKLFRDYSVIDYYFDINLRMFFEEDKNYAEQFEAGFVVLMSSLIPSLKA